MHRLLVVLCALLVPSLGWAQAERRDPFTVEFGLGAAWSGSPVSSGSQRLSDGLSGELKLLAFAPTSSEGMQVGVGTLVGLNGRVTPLVGLRFLSGFETWQTRIDAQLAADLRPSLGLGVRVAFGAIVRVAPGFRLGAEFGALVVAGNLRLGADAMAVAAYSW